LETPRAQDGEAAASRENDTGGFLLHPHVIKEEATGYRWIQRSEIS
jgi:hypothetical protein